MPAVPMVPWCNVPVRFFDPLARRGCADNGLVQAGIAEAPLSPRAKAPNATPAATAIFAKACTHKNFSELNPINSRYVAAQL